MRRRLEVGGVIVTGALHGRDGWCGAFVEVAAEEVAADGGGTHGFNCVKSLPSRCN